MIRTLIADDNLQYSKSIINSVVSKISEIKVDCITTDGIETIDAISKNSFDLVLLDLQMPKRNGIEVLEEIKNLNLIKIPKIIIVSGDLPLLEYANISSTVCDIIQKPVSADNIYERILRVVNEIRYEKSYDFVKRAVIEDLQKIGYNLKHKGSIYMIEAIMYIYRK